MQILSEPVFSDAQGSKSPLTLPRLGQISFINSLPVVLPIERNQIDVHATVVYANPSELNAAYAQSHLDLGAMSSFFYLKHGNLQLLPNISISSDGPVGSVLFFSKVPLPKLQGKTIAVPQSSATSTHLLQVLLSETLNISVALSTEPEPNLNNPDVQGALVIGDQALLIDKLWSSHWQRIDLGLWWQELTNLPMIFGLWAARTDWLQFSPDFSTDLSPDSSTKSNQEQFESISSAIISAKKMGLSSLLPSVIEEAHARSGLPHERLHSYYTSDLNYEMTPRHIQGLEKFRSLLTKHQFLQSLPEQQI